MAATASGFVVAPDGTRLFQRTVGTGEPCLLTPGVGADIDFSTLSRTRRAVFYDIRNRGRSDPVDEARPVGLPVEVDDVDAVRAHVGALSVDVFGWSYVALVVALYAARNAQHVRRVVMACPVAPAAVLQPQPEPVRPAGVVEQLRVLDAQGLEERDPVGYAREWRRIVISSGMADASAFSRLGCDPSDWSNEWPTHMVAALRRVFATLAPDYDYRAEAARLPVPTLVVHGAHDTIPIAASEAWARAIPDSRLFVIPDAGHHPHAESPAAFFGAVEAFLNGAWPAGSVGVYGDA